MFYRVFCNGLILSPFRLFSGLRFLGGYLVAWYLVVVFGLNTRQTSCFSDNDLAVVCVWFLRTSGGTEGMGRGMWKEGEESVITLIDLDLYPDVDLEDSEAGEPGL